MPDAIADLFRQASTKNELGRVDFNEMVVENGKPYAVMTGRYEDNHGNIQTQQYKIDQATLQQRTQNALFETDNPFYRHNITQYSNASQSMNNLNHSMRLEVAASPNFFQ